MKSLAMESELYNKEIEFIFNRFPSFQREGGSAYKPGLENMRKIVAHLGNPHESFKSVHIAGTNGKGSTSHMIAAALSALPKEGSSVAKLKVGLYTSPHLADFRERMKVSSAEGHFAMPSREFVYSFLTENKGLFLELDASFFEITTAMAFYWFAAEKVDVAVVECGLGGRLDATNILTPMLSVITNIGLDHCEYLGNTLEEIAGEKCGIIKKYVPVVVGEKSTVEAVFRRRASQMYAPLVFAEEAGDLLDMDMEKMDLKGEYQRKNIRCAGAALSVLLENIAVPPGSVEKMYEHIYNTASITSLQGRWMTLCKMPHVICDTGHNAHAFKILGGQLHKSLLKNSPCTGRPYGRGVAFFGVVADKDLDAIMHLLPGEFFYFFVNAKGKRALPAALLQEKMAGHGFDGTMLGDGGVEESLRLFFDERRYRPDDFIFIGGSSYVVAEALPFFQNFKAE